VVLGTCQCNNKKKNRKPIQVPSHTKKEKKVRKTNKSQIRFAMNHLFKNEKVGGQDHHV
jgi:hypothetical protein